MDKRLLLTEITMCEACRYFKNDYLGFGPERYSCAHPSGPDGELGEEIIEQRKIHKDCPLVKVGND